MDIVRESAGQFKMYDPTTGKTYNFFASHAEFVEKAINMSGLPIKIRLNDGDSLSDAARVEANNEVIDRMYKTGWRRTTKYFALFADAQLREEYEEIKQEQRLAGLEKEYNRRMPVTLYNSVEKMHRGKELIAVAKAYLEKKGQSISGENVVSVIEGAYKKMDALLNAPYPANKN